MKVATYEAVVENGQIRLSEPVRLPEHMKVYVVVPGVTEGSSVSAGSPRLAQPERADDFAMRVAEGPRDASL